MSPPSNLTQQIRAISGAATFIAFVVGVALAAFGRDVLFPVALAILITILLNAMTGYLRMVPLGPWRMPRWLCMTLSLVLVGYAMVVTVDMTVSTVNEMISRAPVYQENIARILATFKERFGITAFPTGADVLEQIEFRRVANAVLQIVSGLANNALIVAVYVFFLLMEERSFGRKIEALSDNEASRQRMQALMHKMGSQTKEYVLIKTINAALCAAVAYGVMALIGLDFAVFWAFLTFVTYYIPVLGSLIAIALPVLLSLVQFDSFTEALILLVVSGGIQTAIGNILEPRMMGKSLNLSPFVIIVSLFAWGALWGAAGMFLCVPITVITVIILSHFPRTWRIAVLLSSDGNVERPPALTVPDGEAPPRVAPPGR